MPDEYTTLRVKKTTRDKVKSLADTRGVSVDEFIESLTKTAKDDIKQILLNVPKDKFYHLMELANVLYRMKLINNPRIEDAMQLAEDNLIKGMEKSLHNAPITSPQSLSIVK